MNSFRRKSLDTIVDQHADEAAMLWLLRNQAVAAPHYSLKELAELDLRCEAHLEGLFVAGGTGLNYALAALQHEEAGEAFVATLVSLHNTHSEGLARVLAIGNSEAREGFAEALAWLPWEKVEPVAQTSIKHASAQRRYAGLVAYAAHRVDPGPALVPLLTDPDEDVATRALLAVGELGRVDCVPHVQAILESAEDLASRFRAAEALAMVGVKPVGAYLQRFANFNTEFAEAAVRLAPGILSPDETQSWLRSLASESGTRRYALIGCGVVGDPAFVPTIIRQMAVPEYARIAGEAFAMITGIDLARERLDAEPPEGFQSGPTEDPDDEEVALDPDEDLLWPNQALVERWWAQHSGGYQPGNRYLCGQPLEPVNCKRVLRIGSQRQRLAAACELALLEPAQPSFNCAQPGFRQQQLLGAARG